MDCLFCKIVKGEVPCSKVYEDDNFLAFLDISPVNKGHALIVAKKHSKDLLDFPKELESDFLEIAKKVGKAVLEATGADGFNFSMNNGSASGQIIFHSHFHIIPRFDNDGFKHWPKKSYEEGEMDEYAKKIAKFIK